MKPSSKRKTEFPRNFFWGTATAAHQVEGNNIYSDWWYWENNKKNFEKSEEACNQYVCYKEDFQLIKNVLNNNSYRFSIEWARIEPEKGKFNLKEIEHYRKILMELKRLGITPFVTLHHFTNPKWFLDIGGWTNKQNVKYFSRYVDKVATELGDLINYWVVINEPNIYIGNAYIVGVWPPGSKSYLKAFKVYLNMADAHKRAYKITHSKHSDAKVSSAINMMYFIKRGGLENILINSARFLFNDSFLFLTKGRNDYIAINYYFTKYLKLSDIFIKKTRLDKEKFINAEKSDLGWPVYPKGIYKVVMQTFNKYHLPIVISENGIADKDDKKRPQFILDTLSWLKKSIDEGADVKGYFYWSLIDNYEWHIGRSAKFGLLCIDYDTQKRIPRESAFIYSKIAITNKLI